MDHQPISSKKGLAFLSKIRELCVKWPEVEEKIDGFGHSTFRVKNKPFVFVWEREEKGLGVCFKSTREVQDVLCENEAFFKTPYMWHNGWISVKPDMIDWEMLDELIGDGYKLAAPKSILKKLE